MDGVVCEQAEFPSSPGAYLQAKDGTKKKLEGKEAKTEHEVWREKKEEPVEKGPKPPFSPPVINLFPRQQHAIVSTRMHCNEIYLSYKIW